MNPHFLIKYSDDGVPAGRAGVQWYYIRTHQETVAFIEEILNKDQKVPISIEEFDNEGKLILEYKVNATVRLHWTESHQTSGF